MAPASSCPRFVWLWTTGLPATCSGSCPSSKRFLPRAQQVLTAHMYVLAVNSDSTLQAEEGWLCSCGDKAPASHTTNNQGEYCWQDRYIHMLGASMEGLILADMHTRLYQRAGMRPGKVVHISVSALADEADPCCRGAITALCYSSLEMILSAWPLTMAFHKGSDRSAQDDRSPVKT